MMLPLLLALSIYNALSASNLPSPCHVVAQPKLSIAPLRTVRIKVTVEPREPGDLWRQARLCLVDQVGEIRCSMLWEGDSALKAPRTTWVNWEVPPQAAGEYMAVLVVQAFGARCMASDKLQVHGEEPNDPQ